MKAYGIGLLENNGIGSKVCPAKSLGELGVERTPERNAGVGNVKM
jgi:hypothetical protein